MAIILGLLKEHGAEVAESELLTMAAPTRLYATGASALYCSGRVGMVLQPCLSHERSASDVSPVRDERHAVLSFDGRLDNHRELARQLNLEGRSPTDSQIILAAVAHWGEECFSRLIGDWALALWSVRNETLYLARDHAGSRSLYFRGEGSRFTWSTYLDTFQLDCGNCRISEDYVACYLGCQPLGTLTPFDGVEAVPPGHYIELRDGIVIRHMHWTPATAETIRYNSDGEYEAHFLALLEQAVERRTGPGEPVLAQLSGGMDSTAIVCVSDRLRRSADCGAPILDTISFYDDSEVSLNERPYFSLVEARRGKVGIHFNTAFAQRTFEMHDTENGIYLMPGADSFSIEQERQLKQVVWDKGYRSILSGIGGDELLGGVPTPFPELTGHLLSGAWLRLLRQSVAWSIPDRSPLLGTLYATVRYAAQLYSGSGTQTQQTPPWLSSVPRSRTGRNNITRPKRWHALRVAPHRLENAQTWSSVMETLPHLFPQLLFRVEYRYPLLDRDFVEFLFGIPREQILRPARRRSLMRRALVNIVPHEVLERRRKAFQLRAPLSAIQSAYPKLLDLFGDLEIVRRGFADASRLRLALADIANGDSTWRQAMQRTIALELWIRALMRADEKSDQF